MQCGNVTSEKVDEQLLQHSAAVKCHCRGRVQKRKLRGAETNASLHVGSFVPAMNLAQF